MLQLAFCLELLLLVLASYIFFIIKQYIDGPEIDQSHSLPSTCSTSTSEENEVQTLLNWPALNCCKHFPTILFRFFLTSEVQIQKTQLAAHNYYCIIRQDANLSYKINERSNVQIFFSDMILIYVVFSIFSVHLIHST